MRTGGYVFEEQLRTVAPEAPADPAVRAVVEARPRAYRRLIPA